MAKQQTEETKPEVKEVKLETQVIVVSKLPEQPVRRFLNDDGKEVELIPIEEALTEILLKVRRIDKGI